MANNWYVNSAATGTNAGTSWINACTSLSQLLTLGSPPAAGDSIFINSSSAETYAIATTLTFTGTQANPTLIYSVNTTTDQPPTAADILAGASVTTTGNSALTLAGSFYFNGVTFSTGSGAVSANMTIGGNTMSQRYDNCSIQIGGTSGGAIVFANTNSVYVDWENTTVKFASVSSTISPVTNSAFHWRNTPSAILGSTFPTVLVTSGGGTIVFEGVDLSALGSGKSLISGNTQGAYIKDCKLNASVSITSANPTGYITNVFVSNSGSAAGIGYQFNLVNYAGSEVDNTTIVRTGGATTGSQQFTKKLTTTANSKWITYFDSYPMSVWNTLTGSTRTVTVYGVWDSPYGANTPPNNNDIWIEIEYPTDASDPLSGVVNSTIANPLVSTAAYTQDTASTWSGITGFTNPTAWKMVCTLTAQQAGPLTVKVRAAKASTVFYVDPIPVLS